MRNIKHSRAGAFAKLSANFTEPDSVAAYIRQGPPAFTPGHAGLLQMIGVLLNERVPDDGAVLVIGAGGGLETRHLAEHAPGWRFVGVDPAPAMLDLARETTRDVAGNRLTLIEGTVENAPAGPFDAATCILVLGLLADDGAKLALLTGARRRLHPGAPFVLVDHCLDRAAPDFDRRLDRYADYARRSDVDPAIVDRAKEAIGTSPNGATAARDEELLGEAGFDSIETFYVAMSWRGWVAYA